MLESEIGWPMLESSRDAGFDSLLLESRSYMLLARKRGKYEGKVGRSSSIDDVFLPPE